VINCDNDYEKMNYLEQLTYGEANRVVSGYSHLSGERAYDASMMALKDRYGDTDVIASAFIKKALECFYKIHKVLELDCFLRILYSKDNISPSVMQMKR
jgi:hypothetical protein